MKNIKLNRNRLNMHPKYIKKTLPLVIIVFIIFLSQYSFAQVMNWQEHHRGSVYFSIGYNKQWFTTSTIHINQGTSNNYDIVNVTGVDQSSSINPLGLSQYNFRLGCFLNYGQSIGLEFCYDPCRFFIPDNQNVHIIGTFDGVNFDNNFLFSKKTGYYYDIKDGYGTIVLNLVKRFGLYRKVSHKFALDLTIKAGVGTVLPCVEYSLGNNSANTNNNVAGLDADFDAGIKWTSHRHFYIELDYKYDYAMLSNIQIVDGTATQNITSHKFTLNLGYIFSLSKYNPLFDKGYPHRKEIKRPHAMYGKEEDY